MARRAAALLLPQWSSRVFLVELEGAPCFFSLQEKSRGQDVPDVFKSVPNSSRCYSLLVCSSDRIKRAKFYSELRKKLLRDLPKGCDVSLMSSFLPNVKDSVLKGYFLKDTSQSSPLLDGVLRELLRHDPVLVCSYWKSEDGQLWTQRLWTDADDRTVEISQDFCVVPSDAPEYHPDTLNIINSDVFYSFEEAFKVLRELLGTWYAIALTLDACWFKAYTSALSLPSFKVEFFSKDAANIYNYTTKMAGYGFCFIELEQSQYKNGTFTDINKKENQSDVSILRKLDDCPDCIIFEMAGSTKGLALLSRKKKVLDHQLETFRKEAENIGLSNIEYMSSDHVYENCTSDDTEGADLDPSTFGIPDSMLDKVIESFIKCVVGKDPAAKSDNFDLSKYWKISVEGQY